MAPHSSSAILYHWEANQRFNDGRKLFLSEYFLGAVLDDPGSNFAKLESLRQSSQPNRFISSKIGQRIALASHSSPFPLTP